MATGNKTPGWDCDLTGAYIKVFVDELLTGPEAVTVCREEAIAVTATVSSVETDDKTLRPVLHVGLHDDDGSEATVSPYSVLLLALKDEEGY